MALCFCGHERDDHVDDGVCVATKECVCHLFVESDIYWGLQMQHAAHEYQDKYDPRDPLCLECGHPSKEHARRCTSTGCGCLLFVKEEEVEPL